MAVTRLPISVFALADFAEFTALDNTASNIAAKMPMMAMTVSSSTRVNARLISEV